MYPWLNVSQLFNLTLRTQGPEPQGPLPMGPLPEFELDFPDFSPVGVTPQLNPYGGAPPVGRTSASGLSAAQLATPAPPAVSTGPSASQVAQLVGGGLSALGTFFGVKAQQEELKTQSLSLEHEASMSAITARQAEREAQSIIEAGAFEKAGYGLQANADAATRAATMAGRGMRLGAGSAAEVQASGKFIEAVDKMSIDLNTANAAAAARTQGVNALNRGLLVGVSARNRRRSAGNDLLSLGAAGTSLLGSLNRYSESRNRRE
jgi:hypothetical protein